MSLLEEPGSIIMAHPLRLGKQKDKMTERILNLTLEIIYLLTGEDCTVVKKTSGDRVPPSGHPCWSGGWSWNPTIRSPPNSLTPEENNDLRILEVTQKIIELLTGEVPIRCQDVTVYFSMEEWEYLEGHKDIYKDVMMEKRPPLTSPDGSRSRNTPERCPRPLYSQDYTQEDQEILQTHSLHSQESTVEHHEMPRKDQEIPQAHLLYSGSSTQERQEIPQLCLPDSQDSTEEHNEMPQDHQEIPQTCPQYSHNSTQSHEQIPQAHPLCSPYSMLEDQMDEPGDLSDNMSHEDPITSDNLEDINIIAIKVEDLSDEEMEDDETLKEEEPVLAVTTDQQHRRYKKMKHSFTSTAGKTQDYDVCHNYLMLNPTSQNYYNGQHCANEPFSPITYSRSFPASLTHCEPEGDRDEFLCFECGKCFNKQTSLDRHRQLMHIWEKPHACSECDKCFKHKISLVRHQRIHNNENKFSCPLCRRCFAQKSHLVEHERQHTGEKPYECTECGKRFAVKRALVSHESTHLGQKQFRCPECGKCFTRRSYLFTHQRIHLRDYGV